MYKGAGILFYKRMKGKTYIFLGKRTINPSKGYWSISGGKISVKDYDSFYRCALRETRA